MHLGVEISILKDVFARKSLQSPTPSPQSQPHSHPKKKKGKNKKKKEEEEKKTEKEKEKKCKKKLKENKLTNESKYINKAVEKKKIVSLWFILVISVHDRYMNPFLVSSFTAGKFALCNCVQALFGKSMQQDARARTHSRARAHTQTHTHARTHARTHACTHAHTHTYSNLRVTVLFKILASKVVG